MSDLEIPAARHSMRESGNLMETKELTGRTLAFKALCVSTACFGFLSMVQPVQPVWAFGKRETDASQGWEDIQYESSGGSKFDQIHEGGDASADGDWERNNREKSSTSKFDHVQKPGKLARDEENVDDEDKEQASEPAKEIPRKPVRKPLVPDETDPSRCLRRAKKFTNEGNYIAALVEINQALMLSPQYWEARYQGAYIYQLQGRTREAIQRYEDFLERRPDHVEGHINLGSLLRKDGDLLAAEVHYKKAAELNHFSLDAHYNLSNLYIQQGKLEQALKELQMCMKIKPDDAWVHNNLGVVYQRRHYLEEAEEEFLRALHLEPANRTFENNLEQVRTLLKKKPVKA